MGTVFQSYSITWSQPWRVIAYHIVLIPLVMIGVHIFSWFWSAGYGLINYVFGCEWFMGAKLSGMVNYATSLVYPSWLCNSGSCFFSCIPDCITSCLPQITCSVPTASGSLSGTETFAGIILAIFLFLIGLSILSYGLSIISVGETLMFIIFKKKSDDDDLLQRKDEDELEEDDDFTFDDDDSSSDSDDNNSESEDSENGDSPDSEEDS